MGKEGVYLGWGVAGHEACGSVEGKYGSVSVMLVVRIHVTWSNGSCGKESVFHMKESAKEVDGWAFLAAVDCV